MSRKVKVSDVRQGVTLYYVHAFPHKGLPSRIDTFVVTKRPESMFAVAKIFFDDELGTGWFTRLFSLRDAGIIPNSYNFHKTFTSLKAAKLYAARMDRKCLTKQEREKVLRRQELSYG